MSIRVLVADDQALVRDGIATILDSEPDSEVVGEAVDGQQAVKLCREVDPDVVLMDIQMPVLDGLVAARRIIEQDGAKPQVVMLTTFERDDYLFEALRAGASGFLLKSAGADELIDAVRTIAGGDALLAPSVTRRIIDHFATAPVDPTVHRELERLTIREREVLREVATGKSNSEIAETLFVTEATVKTHVSRILAKLGLRDRAPTRRRRLRGRPRPPDRGVEP
jgi:DNA-binding NarL/FixJ family response regulator